MALHPYAPEIDAASVRHLPKTDLHVHAETYGRFMRVVEQRRGLAAYSHRDVMERHWAETPAGLARLVEVSRLLRAQADRCVGRDCQELAEEPDFVEAGFEQLMEEEASCGSMLAEIRCGGGWVLFPHFLTCFRGAERRVRARHPGFHAEPLIAWGLVEPGVTEVIVRYTCELASDGIAGVDLYPEYRRYEHLAICRMAERAAEAGLGIVCHDGEFEPESLRRSLDIPGLTRVGHATQAWREPGLLDEFARRGIVVEVSLSSNVVLGAVASYEEHPLRRFIDAGVGVTLCSDDPLTFATDIGREYAIASMLGFSEAELRSFARTGIEASFTSRENKAALLDALDAGVAL